MLLPGHEPGGRDPAPGPLRLVQQFVNTYNHELPGDGIGTSEQLVAFCAEHALALDGPVLAADVARAVELREALRLLLMANNGHPHDPAAPAVVEHAARAAQLTLRLGDGGAALVAQAPGVDGALGEIVAVAYAAMADGSWQRLKACRRDVCQWAFYDHSRNRSGAWCAMAICGNRTKTRGYRRRMAG